MKREALLATFAASATLALGASAHAAEAGWIVRESQVRVA